MRRQELLNIRRIRQQQKSHWRTSGQIFSRVKDILGELENQVGPLKEQSETARKHLDLLV